jgi:hypothetical protein
MSTQERRILPRSGLIGFVTGVVSFCRLPRTRASIARWNLVNSVIEEPSLESSVRTVIFAPAGSARLPSSHVRAFAMLHQKRR